MKSKKKKQKRCGFVGCGLPIPDEGECCDNCCFEIHVEIRRLQGVTRDQATAEWRREQGASRN